MPWWARNSSTRRQKIQPGWLKTTTDLALVMSPPRSDPLTLWTWCAWDSLFIPELLDTTAHVESPDPDTGEVVRLDVGPRGVTTVEPGTAVVSFLMPDAMEFDKSATNVMATFCNFVFFFASRKSGERWVAKHPGTFLYSLDEAVALARRLNAKVFGLALGQQARRGR
jgi:alkylmercury lyase